MHVLLHFVMLSGKIAAFDGQLKAQIDDLKIRTALRRQLPGNIFVQFLAGPRDLREGIVGALLWLIALITLVFGPFALLALFELQFLPYHQASITWLQRVVLVTDVILAWRFWPDIVRRDVIAIDRDGAAVSRVARLQRHLLPWAVPLAGGAAVLLVFLIATFPGEWLERTIARLGQVPLRGILVDGEIDPAKGVPESWFSNRLVLPRVEAIEYLKQDTDGKIVSVRRTVSLRLRDLRRAVLSGAQLRKVDLTAADLSGATLEDADLREALLSCALPFEDRRDGSQRPIKCTQLQGAFLDGASLQGANLESASLQGAVLGHASLQGASLDGALLWGAMLPGATLQGASLKGARLQGANLQGVLLQGASLDEASLDGASLDGASLQGTSLSAASLRGASLVKSFVWRADASYATIDRTNAQDIRSRQEAFCNDPQTDNVCDWTAESFRSLRTTVETAVPDGTARRAALDRIDRALNPDHPFEPERAITSRWQALRDYPIEPEVVDAERARQWKAVGCKLEGGPYVVATMARRLDARFPLNSPHPAAIAAAFLDPSCNGARGISAATTAILERRAHSGTP